jgi:hypothetical protein
VLERGPAADSSREAPSDANSPITRRKAVVLAIDCVDHFDRMLRDRSACLLDMGFDRLSVVEALRGYLTQLIADAIQGGTIRTSIRAQIGARLRPWVWCAREMAIGRLNHARGLGAFMGTKGQPSRRVLAVPRAPSHLRDMLRVGRIAEQAHGLAFHWLVFRPDHAKDLARVVLAPSYAPSGWSEVIRLSRELSLAGRAWLDDLRPSALSECWEGLVSTVCDGIRAQLLPTVIATRAISKAMIEVAPELVLVGNPFTMEGVLAIAAGRAHGVPCTTIQHGEIGMGHLEWARAGVDLVTVWGPHARSTVAKLGFPEKRVVITGAPWADAIGDARRGGGRARDKKRILVALSGAGHSVGLAEHLGHVRRLLETTKLLFEHEWMFRLHPKDDPEIYERMLRTIPGSKAQIVPATGPRRDIHEELERSDVLITVTSASAFDAMLARVPVVTLARPLGELDSAFVIEGATTHVRVDESLAERLRLLFEHGEAEETRARAERFIANLFGPRDGRAAERVASALAEIAGLSRSSNRAHADAGAAPS